ncbi:MAG: alpha/beta hydrolase, partial [Thermomicrobiales bacterium]
SYGGAVITDAASQVKSVIGLVYVAAFIPDKGESIQGLAGKAKDSLLGPALRPAPYATSTGSKPGTEFFINPASFHDVFSADLSAEQAEVMAVTQRPAADLAFGEPTQNPAWKTLPSWAVVATADKAIGVTGSRLMAKRAGSTTVEVDASHVVMLSHPDAVIEFIHTALGTLS